MTRCHAKVRKLSQHSVIGILLAVFIIPIQALGDVAALTRLLEDYRIPYDRSEANAITFDSLLKYVDPYAVRLGTNRTDAAKELASVLTIKEWPDAIMYVKLNGFYDMGTTSVTARLRKWTTNEVVGVIIDLRGAGGDNLAAADAMVGDIIEEDAALYEIRDGLGNVTESHRSTHGPKIPNMPPLMLLVNEETHGASETFSAVCATRSGLMLIGSPTHGDAGLRETVALNESNTLYIATRWIVPFSGVRYDGDGVQPHILVRPQPSRAPDNGSRKQEPDAPDAQSKFNAERDSAHTESSNDTEMPSPGPNGEDNVHSDLETPDVLVLDPVQERALDILLGLDALRKK